MTSSRYFALLAFNLIVILLILSPMSCTALGRAQAVTTGLDVGICVARNLDKPLPLVVAECAKDNISKEDVERMFSEQQLAAQRYAAKQLSACQCSKPVSSSPDAGSDSSR